MTNINADLVAYIALGDFAKTVEDKSIKEDVEAKMRVHSYKIKSNNPGISFKF